MNVQRIPEGVERAPTREAAVPGGHDGTQGDGGEAEAPPPTSQVSRDRGGGGALRAHLAEFGLVANPGIANLVKLADKAFADETLPPFAHRALEILIRRMAELTDEIGMLDAELKAWHASNEASRRLAAIPGIGVITATAIAATVTDPDQFRSGRQFAAWLGLTPQQHSTGGKTRLGGISKQGDRYLRRLLVVGATAVMRHAKRNPTPMTDWVNNLLEKKPFRLVSVALANKLARIAWAVLTRGETYRPYGLAA
jgi:transposase